MALGGVPHKQHDDAYLKLWVVLLQANPAVTPELLHRNTVPIKVTARTRATVPRKRIISRLRLTATSPERADGNVER